MNRVEIKKKAKEMIRGNKWYLWKPLLIISLITCIIGGVTFGLDAVLGLSKEVSFDLFGEKVTYYQRGILSNIGSMATSFISSAFGVGYAMFVLSFVRGKKLEFKDIIEFMKKNWVIAFGVSLVVGLNIGIGMILLIVPGAIAAVGLMFYREVCADNPKLKLTEILRKAWNMTNGHKMDLFIFGLSFFGWIIISPLTLGLLYIWLMPYMIVAMALAYENLRK